MVHNKRQNQAEMNFVTLIIVQSNLRTNDVKNSKTASLNPKFTGYYKKSERKNYCIFLRCQLCCHQGFT